MPAISDLPQCPLCLGQLLPLSVCQSCNTVAVRDGLVEVSPQIRCEACGASNPSLVICSACHSRFPLEDVVKSASATCPSCKATVPPSARMCPNCRAPLVVTPPPRPRTRRRIRGEFGPEDVSEVSRIPSLGEARARELCRVGYNRLWKIQRASEAELAAVKGIGPEVAAKVHGSVQSLFGVGQRKTKDEVLSEECACPLCGTVTSLFATRCHDCGASFDDEELDEEFRKEVAQEEEMGLLAYYDVRLLDSPDDLELLYARAVLLIEMGHASEALSALEGTLAMAPKHQKSLQAKARALAAAQGVGPASQVLRRTLETISPLSILVTEDGASNAGARRSGEAPPAGTGKSEEDRAAEAAFAALDALSRSPECPECGEPLHPGATTCPVCGHRLATGPVPPTHDEASPFEGEHLLDDLQRTITGEGKQPPPPLVPEIPQTTLDGKRMMLAFLSKIPGVSKRAADAVSGFFQDLEQVGLADVIDIADLPDVAPAEARLIKVAVARHLAPAEPRRPPPKAPTPTAKREVRVPPPPAPSPAPPPAPAVSGTRPTGAPAPRPTGFELRRGMVNGRGHVNGRGRVNGIINGTGFVNGVAIAQLQLPRRGLLQRYITIGASLLLLFAVVALYIAPGTPPRGITIDGGFDDWNNEQVPLYVGGTASSNPGVHIVGSSVHVDDDRGLISLRVKVEGKAFSNPTRWESLYAFLDVDGNESTGYDLGDIGADYAIRLSGLNTSLAGVEDARLMRYAERNPDPSRTDWTGFETVVAVEAGVSEGDIETAVYRDALVNYTEDGFRVRFAFDDNAGETSHTVVPIGKAPGALLVEQSPEATILGGGLQPLLTLTFTSLGGETLKVSHVVLRTQGGLTLAPDPIPEFSVFPGRPEVRTISVDATGAPAGTLVSVGVSDVNVSHEDGLPRQFGIAGTEARAYVVAPAPGKVIDGLFDDWRAPIADTDSVPIPRRSLNILSREANVTGDQLFLYARLGGDALEGGVTPEKVARPPPLAPGGTASSAPETRPPPLLGVDYIRFFVDTDAGMPGGFAIGGIHADRYLEIWGRGGRVLNATVYRFEGTVWVLEGSPEWGIGEQEIEVGATLVGAAFNGTQFVAMTADWSGIADRSDPADTRAARGATRGSQGSPIVLDVSGNGPFWFRDNNHGTETTCTYNKVAKSVKGAGPVKTITLNTGESACWYVDETLDAVIPTGTWETLMDIGQTGGADYDVRLEIWNLDTDSVAETIQSCLDQTSFGDDTRCFLDSVPSKDLTSTQVVRLVLAHSSASGTITIDYDDSDGSGDSRATLPIPEFRDVATGAAAAAFLVIGLGFRHRRLCRNGRRSSQDSKQLVISHSRF